MPIKTYFATTGPLLLAILLALSAYLEPEGGTAPSEILTIDGASGDHDALPPGIDNEGLEFERLSRFPLLR